MFRSLMIIVRQLYLNLTKVIFMLKHSVKLRRGSMTLYNLTLHCTQHTCRSTVSFCTAHNTHAALRLAATSPNLYNDIILPNFLT